MSASEARRGPSPTSTVTGAGTPEVTTARRRSRHATKVLPEFARTHNRALVLQVLFHRGAMSRADLARATGLTRVTISDLVSDLIADGFIVEKGVREVSRPGKPAIIVDLDHTGHRIVGIDLSGPDAFVGGILTLDGTIMVREEIPRPETDVVATIVAFAKGLVADCHAPVLGVGVGSPGIVDDAGVVLTAPNLGLVGFDLAGTLREALDLPVIVANDANAAVLAEHTFGDAGDDVILVKVGRGVGSGLLSDGRPMIGSRFAAGEIGHVTVATDGGPLCSCGKIGCLEAWISAPALNLRLAEASDEDARVAVLHDAGERLAIALAPVVGALDLSEVVLSGPPELLDGPFAAATVETLRTRTLAGIHEGIRVRMTEQGEDIVLRGAAVMVLSGQLGVS